MPGEGGCIAQNDEFHAGSGDSNIHAAQVVEETNLSLFIGTYKGDDDDIAFLSLEPINSIYRNEVVERFEKGFATDGLSQVLYLCLIGRNDSEVDAFLQDALLADTGDVGLQLFQGKACFGFVYTAETFAYELFVTVHPLGIYPYHGGVVVEYATVFHFGSSL